MKGGGCSGGDGDGDDGGGAEVINRKFMRDVHSVLESFFFQVFLMSALESFVFHSVLESRHFKWSCCGVVLLFGFVLGLFLLGFVLGLFCS